MSRKILSLTLGFAAASVFMIEPALAGGGGGGLPWEGPLQQIQQSITGPVAGAIALAAVAIAGAMLIFGGELNDFARRLISLFGAGGASIGVPQVATVTELEPADG
jgi:type IV secretion system protein VirB2